MISGPGGVGKSRLAMEFGLTVPPGWAAGWLHAGADGDAVGAVRAAGKPALIVVDDADGRTDLVLLLESLARQPADPVIRVILVTRSADGLRAALGLRLEERHAWIAADAVSLELDAAGGPDDWGRWYAEAATAFAAALGRPVPAAPEQFAQGPADAAEPFVIMQAQALLAVLGAEGDNGDPHDLPFERIAGALMRHEQRWWRTMAAAWEWGDGGPPAPEVQERCIAVLAFLGSDGTAEAGQVLRRVPELGDASAERLAAIASWGLALYPPGVGRASGIRPDLIGDWFVVSQLTADPGLAHSLRDGLTDDQAARALALLARAADSIASAGRLFSEFAAGDIRRAILAAAQAARTGRAGRRLLDAIIAAQLPSAQEWTLDQLSEVKRLIPEHILVQTHVTLAGLTVNAYRALAAGNPAAHQADLATALNDLGARLDRVGRYQDALRATREAVTLYRALAAGNPAAHQAGLATALTSHGTELYQLGRYQDALRATREAVTLYRALAAGNPAAHQAGLATALTSHGTELYQLGRYQDALRATREAVTLYRALAVDSPQVGLAMALDNLGVLLHLLGRYQDALQAAQEAVTLYRALAVGNPAAHQADLAMALSNLGARLDRVGRYQDALQPAQEAVTLYRALAADSPQAGLAMALSNLGTRLDRVGRHQEALQATREAVTLYRALAAGNPAAHQADLASALTNFGVGLDRVGRYQDALRATREAVTLRRALAAGNPAAHQADLATALTNLSAWLDRVGRYQDALQAAQEAVTLYRALAAGNPAAHQAELATALTNLGTELYQLGRYQEMLMVRTEAVHICRELAEKDPDLYQAEYQRRLGALRREYDQRGMSYEAITHGLPPRDTKHHEASALTKGFVHKASEPPHRLGAVLHTPAICALPAAILSAPELRRVFAM